MLIVRAHASETARMEIIVAIADTLQKAQTIIRILIQNITLNHCQTEWNPKGGDHGQRKGRKEGKDG
jgi:hypothetical protein